MDAMLHPAAESTRATAPLRAAAAAIGAPIRRRPVAAFLILAFVGMWASLSPALFLGAPMRLSSAIGAFLGLALSAFVVTAIAEGGAGVRDLLGRSLRWRVGVRRYALALLALPAAMFAIASAMLGGSPLAALAGEWGLLLTVLVPEVLIALASIQLCEEIGWTGFAQHRLQGRLGAFRASLVVAAAFALIHFPTYLAGSPITGQRMLQAVVMMVPVALFAAFFRVLLTWAYNDAGGSVPVAALVHAVFNTVSGATFTPAFVPVSIAAWLPLAAVAALAVLATAATRGRLAYPSDDAAAGD